MQSVLPEEVTCPSDRFTRTKVAPLAFYHEAKEASPHVLVHPVELLCGIPGAEVVAPPAQDRVQVADQHPHILHSVPVSSGELLHALPSPLHASRRGPPLEEVDAMALLLPDRSAHALVQVATEKVEPLPSPAQVDLPRFLRVQLQSQPCKGCPHALLGLVTGRLRVAHHHEVVRVAHQCSQMGVPALPRRVE